GRGGGRRPERGRRRQVQAVARPSRRRGAMIRPMSDETIATRIESLVQEEHALLGREQQDAGSAEHLEDDRRRLDQISVELDRCWDLLRRRRALRDAGQNPDEAEVRDADTVERYLQ